MTDLRNDKTIRPTITVLLATYNRAHFLAESLESILAQTWPPDRVIVIDDGSIDQTPQVLEGFRERIEVIRQENRGKASALNLGLISVTSDLIWIFDDDDVALPDALEKLATALTKHPECGFSYGSYDHLIKRENGDWELDQLNLHVDNLTDFRLSVLERCYIFQPGLLVRRSCYQDVGPFDETLLRSQDYDMLIRLTRRYNGVMVESVVFHQRQHRGTAGPTTSPQSRRQKDTTWIQYDRAIFSRVYDEYALNEYLSAREFGGGALSSSQQRAAILERCCILSRKGMWNLAAADLKTFAGLIRESHTPDLAPSERTTLRRFFGPYSYAEHTLADAGIFFGCLRNSFSPRLRLQFAIQLLSPWLIELINFLRTMQFRCFLGRTRKCLLLCVKMLKSPRIAQTSVGPVSRSEF